MVSVCIIPCLAALGISSAGFSLSDQGIILTGLASVAACIGMIVIAQISPTARLVIFILMGIASGLVLGALVVAILVVAFIFAACGGM